MTGFNYGINTTNNDDGTENLHFDCTEDAEKFEILLKEMNPITATIKTLSTGKIQVQIFKNNKIVFTVESKFAISADEYIPILNNSLQGSSLSGYTEAIMNANQ